MPRTLATSIAGAEKIPSVRYIAGFPIVMDHARERERERERERKRRLHLLHIECCQFPESIECAKRLQSRRTAIKCFPIAVACKTLNKFIAVQSLVDLINIKFRVRFPSYRKSYCRVKTMLKLHNGCINKIDLFLLLFSLLIQLSSYLFFFSFSLSHSLPPIPCNPYKFRIFITK